jgi:hypothetical protein
MDRTRHVLVDARAELETQACDEADEADEEQEDVEEDHYNIDVDWPPVRAVPVVVKMSKAVEMVAFDVVEAPAPPRWVPWARGAYDPAVHGCSSGLRKK